MDIKAVIEVGIAVRDLEQATRHFVKVLGAKASEIKNVDRFKMRYRMCKVGGMDFEIMESTSEGGVIDKFLKSNGEGLHHIAFKVSNLDQMLQELKKNEIRLIDEEPKSLGDEKYAFVHPKSFFGVMFELIEERKEKPKIL